MISKREDRKTNWNFPADDINAEGTPVLLFSFSSSPFFPFFFSFLFFFSSLLAGTILLETVSAVR